MDKEPSLTTIWTQSIILATLSLYLCRQKWYLFVFTLASIPMLFPFFDIYSRDVGPHIIVEAGPSYIYHTHLAAALVLIATMTGIFLYFRKRKLKKLL